MERSPPHRVAGGYIGLTPLRICIVWNAYHTGRIRWVDLRTWFACLEMAERRRIAGLQNAAVHCKFTLAEVAALTNAGRVRQGVNRLQRAGLLRWSESSIELVESPDGLPGDVSGVWAMLARIENNARTVPVPRRVVRTIAGGGWTPCQVATALGHLLRCVYRRRGGITAEGSCSASWVADTFGVTARSVKTGRRDLIEAGWLTPLPSDHWRRQRYGGFAAVNLQWGIIRDSIRERAEVPVSAGVAWNPQESAGVSGNRLEGARSRGQEGRENMPNLMPPDYSNADFSPPTGPSGAGFSPPDQTLNPGYGYKNQEPGADAGFSRKDSDEQNREKPTCGPRGPSVRAGCQRRDGCSAVVGGKGILATVEGGRCCPGVTAQSATVVHPAGGLHSISGICPGRGKRVGPRSHTKRSERRSGQCRGRITPPTMRRVALSDLTDTGRAFELLEDAVHRGCLHDTEADRLRFLAGIAWALRVGNDPPRIFAWLVRARAWDRITLADEDRGQAMIREGLGVERGRPYNPYPTFEEAMLDMRARVG